MTGPVDPSDALIGLQGRALDRLLPMHLWFGPDGTVSRAGPTLTKMIGAGDLTRRAVFDLMDIQCLPQPLTVAGLLALDGQRLSVRLRALPDLQLRGQLVALPGGTGGLMNLSLGFSFAEAVDGCGLTLADFSPCDHTVDLLYLREAIAAISAESLQLTDRLISAERAAEARAMTDALTGLANRRALSDELRRLIDRPSRGFALMHLDLDRFKEVNDRFGHPEGDEMLRHAAREVQAELRDTDMLARIGGDEFVILFRDCEATQVLDSIARRITRRVSRPVRIDGAVCRIGVSIGIARSSDYAGPDAERMLRDADAALYASKRAGRGRHSFHQPGADTGTPLA
ncbi:diguanylate cyclase [Rhodobacterales bacterium HKCCE3408]|nr:diguanylate cyclase [Rhodobacterales bacterium HKCCE3408]